MALNKVCVIVVNHRAGPLLLKCLGSLAAQTRKPDRVIVMDNASGDPFFTAAQKTHPRFEFVRMEKNAGFAAANNMGVKMADNCGWIALLNPDAYADPKWIETLVSAQEKNKRYTFFASRILSASMPGFIDSAGDVYHVSGKAWSRGHAMRAQGVFTENDEVFGPCAAGAMYRRDVFMGAGGFDESFFLYMEDVDLAFRLRLRGHECLYVADAVVHHEGSASSGKMSDTFVYHSSRNMVWTFMKNMTWPMLAVYLPQFLTLNIASVLAYAVKGRIGAALKGKWDAFMGLPAVIEKRADVHAEMTASPERVKSAMAKGVLTPYLARMDRER